MATQVPRKPASKAPVTKHPLFPAMVALWFGALFGLGSLAVRASLLESLVLSLSLDVLLPAAAPPLGLKARLILALLLAAIGVAVGAYLARRIARPRPVETPRRRGVNSRFAGRSGRDEAAAEVEAPAARRRPLTIEVEEATGHHFDAAPLPGGSTGIFDVTQIDLTPGPVEVPEMRETEHVEVTEEAPLALDGFIVEERAQTGYAPYQSIAQPPVEAIEEPAAQFAPPPQAERQVFGMAPQASVIADQPAPDAAESAAWSFHAPADPVVQPVEEPLEQIAKQQVPNSAEFPVEAEADEYAQMIDALRHIESPAAAQPTAGAFEPPAPAQWTGEAPLGSETAITVEQWPAEPQPLPVVPPVLLVDPLSLHRGFVPDPVPDTTPDALSVRRIETAELGELSPVELVERLALAMRQRAHKGPLPVALVDAVSSLVASVPAEVPADAPEAFVVPEAEPVSAAQPTLDLHDVLPAEGEAPSAEPEAPPPASARLALPAALRPIDFSDYADHDDTDLAVPPRSFVAPPVAEPAAAPVRLAEPEPAIAAALPVVDEAEGEVPEDSYSSLLELARPNAGRQDFVRIEEPEEDASVIEPVVIFPGHGARPGLRFAAPDPAAQAQQAELASQAAAAEIAAQTSAVADSGGPQLRRFDAPSATAAHASPLQSGGIRQDPEEAQRALRSALATLQRMSGAA